MSNAPKWFFFKIIEIKPRSEYNLEGARENID